MANVMYLYYTLSSVFDIPNVPVVSFWNASLVYHVYRSHPGCIMTHTSFFLTINYTQPTWIPHVSWLSMIISYHPKYGQTLHFCQGYLLTCPLSQRFVQVRWCPGAQPEVLGDFAEERWSAPSEKCQEDAMQKWKNMERPVTPHRCFNCFNSLSTCLNWS